MSDADYKTILAAYGFKDQHGHPLENCKDFTDLLKELEELREQSGARYSPQVEERLKANLRPRPRK